MPTENTLSRLAAHVGHAFARLADIVESPDAFRGVMLELGWRCDTVPAPLAALGPPARELGDRLGDGVIGLDELPAVLQAIRDLTDAIAGLSSLAASMPAHLVADGFAEQIPQQLLDYLLVDYLDDACEAAVPLLTAIGVIRDLHLDDQGNRPGSIQQTVAWEQLPRLLTDPRQLFVDACGWGQDVLDVDALLEPLLDLGESLGLSVALDTLPEELRAPLGYDEDDESVPMLTVLLVHEADGMAGVRVCPLPPKGARKAGLGILPFLEGSLPDTIHLSDRYRLSVETDLAVASVAILLRPSSPIEILSPITGGQARGEITAAITYTGGTAARMLLLGSSDGTRVQATAVSLTAGATTDGPGDLFLELQLADAQLIIDGGEGSSFLGALLGDAARTIELSPAIGWSVERGAFLPGGAGFTFSLPMQLSLGPVTIKDAVIELAPDGDRLDIDTGASLAATIGPFSVLTDTMGVTGTFRFPGSGGNLGPLDAEVGFLPPTLLVFALDTGAVSGGGLLHIDPESGRYSGGLALDIFGLGISAIVVVDTGEGGWALFASIGVIFPTPVPIGFGFTVIGVGGLIAVNRTIDVNALASGLKTGAADAVLFPDDFLNDAAAILSGLDHWFPLASGTTTFGPVAAIGWGSPTLITAQLGVAIALPDLIVGLLGSVEVLLPTKEDPLLEFRMDILGAVDVPASEVVVAASLHDSSLLGVFELSGDMGFYARLSGRPLFLLSIGGYHPHFDPPGALPSWILDLRRTSAAIRLADDVHVTLTSYVAVTSNTVQFGGSFKLVASVKVLLTTYTAEGRFAINLLLVLTPLKFSARASAGVSISAGDRELFGIQLTARLAGPKPWFASGRAFFTFFGLDVDFGFEIGARPGGEPRALHDVVTDVMRALQADGAWTPVDAAGSWGAGVVLTDTRPAGLWVRPDQLVEIRQNVAPLNRTITAFGEFVPEVDVIVADRVTLGGNPVANPAWIDDWFAPAQFDRLDEGGSLSAPSYELMTAGLRFGDDRVIVSADLEADSTSVSREPEESIYPDIKRKRSRFVGRRANPRGRPAARTVNGPRLRVKPTSYTVVRTADGRRARAVLGDAGLGRNLTYAEATRIVTERATLDPRERARLRVVPSSSAMDPS